MKNLFLVLLIITCHYSFGQGNTEQTQDSFQITMVPLVVTSSAVISFNFEESKSIEYKIYKNETEIYSFNIAKNTGNEIRKVDLSFLENGDYIIKFFIERNKVAESAFNKL